MLLPSPGRDAELARRVERLAHEGFEVSVAATHPLDPSIHAEIARHTPDVFALGDFLAPADHARFVRYLRESRRPVRVLGEEALARAPNATPLALDPPADSLVQRLRVRAELDEIESPRSWQTVEWIASHPGLRAASRILLPPGAQGARIRGAPRAHPDEPGVPADPGREAQSRVPLLREAALVIRLGAGAARRLSRKRSWVP